MKNICSRRHFIKGCGVVLGSMAMPNITMSESFDRMLPPLSDFYRNLKHLAVAGHRGAFQFAPENSLASLQSCIDLGVEVTEIDVRATTDGIPVLFHDSDLYRMIGRDTYLNDITLSELQKLPLRDKGGSKYQPITTETVPTLEQAFEFAKGKLYLHLDIKDRTIIDQLPALMRKTGMTDYVKINKSVKNMQSIDALKQAEQYYNCIIVPHISFKEKYLPKLLPLLQHLDTPILSAKFDDIATLYKVVPVLQQYGIKLECNTLKFSYSVIGYYDTDVKKNPDKVWGELYRAGVNVLMTDHLQEITEWRKIL